MAAQMIDVRMLCLAALMGHEASGYDIKKELERGSAAGLIDASFGSIYPALARLTDEGLIAARSEGGRGRSGRTVYAVTPQGRDHFLDTLSGPLPDDKYRSPFLFAMLFVEGLPRARVRSMIDGHIAQMELKLAEIDRLNARPAGGKPSAGAQFVYGFGEASLRTGLAFLRRNRASLEDAAIPDPHAGAAPFPGPAANDIRPDGGTEGAAATTVR
jgi:DNA-binding PadR family transcriptional regulator